MRILVAVLALSCLVSSASAQEITIDGSTKETYERSIKAMADGLPDGEKEAFARGLINLIVTLYPPAKGAEGLALLQFMEPALDAAHITLNEVSRAEILAKGHEILADEAVMAASPAETDGTGEVRACLQAHVLVENAEIERGSYGRHLTFDVTNNLPWAIAGIWVEYVAMSEGRSVPWHKDDFSLGISGGVEPGETRNLRTSATLFPKEAPDELQTSAIVLDVTDPLERQLIGDVKVLGWAEERSPMTCE